MNVVCGLECTVFVAMATGGQLLALNRMLLLCHSQWHLSECRFSKIEIRVMKDIELYNGGQWTGPLWCVVINETFTYLGTHTY